MLSGIQGMGPVHGHEGAAVSGSETVDSKQTLARKRGREEVVDPKEIYPEPTAKRLKSEQDSLGITSVNPQNNLFDDENFYGEFSKAVLAEVLKLQQKASGDASMEGSHIAAQIAKKALKTILIGALSFVVTPVGAMAIVGGADAAGSFYYARETRLAERRASDTIESLSDSDIDALIEGSQGEKIAQLIVMKFYEAYGAELRQVDTQQHTGLAKEFTKAIFTKAVQKEVGLEYGGNTPLDTYAAANGIHKVFESSGVSNPDWANLPANAHAVRNIA